MATYVLPQVLVFQEFDAAVAAASNPLNACIFGGHAFLRRYEDSSEKAAAYLGQYDNVGALVEGDYKTCYSWPQKPVGSLIDETYTKVFIDNALLRYFWNTSHSASKVAANKIKLSGVSFIDNPRDAVTYPRDGAFKDRDVQIGDSVKIVGDNGSGGDPVTLFTYVRGFAAETVAASVGSATAYGVNHATQILSTSNSADSGNSGDATIDAVTASSYNGHPTGDIDETYTVEVIQSSTGGDATTGRLRVTSASGRDDVSVVTPAAFGDPTTIGTRGLTVTWDNTSTEFTEGDIWTVVVHQAYTAPTVASGGTYTGTSDRTYIVEVTSGGAFAALPKITVTAADGSDYSGPTTVATSGSAVAIGTKGLTITFTGSALLKGTRWTVAATAATTGEYETLVLGHNIQSDIDSNFEISLYIKRNIELDSKHVATAGAYNWEQSNTELCVFADVQAYDSTFTDAGELVPLDVIYESGWEGTNKLYVEYRAWLPTLASALYGISDVADLDTAISGPLVPDNELKWGVYKALSNSNGQEVKFSAVADPTDTESWSAVLGLIEERSDVHGLVPLTRNATVLGLVKAHVLSRSNEVAGRWRRAWFNVKVDPTQVVASAANSSDEAEILATTEDDSGTSGTQYTLLRVPDGNSLFVTNGVRAGDVVRYQYATDVYGDVTYNEYVVDSVVNESTLLLATGTTVAESTPRKVEVWRTISTQELSEQIGAASGNYGNRRISAVWPDEFSDGAYTQEGYFLCAALAGLRSGVVPQQGLTNLELSGVTAVPRTTELFNRSQLDDMAVNGCCIVTQDSRSGQVFCRHAVTTGDYAVIDEREEMLTSNLDSISFYFQDTFSPYIGISNVTPGMLDIIEAEASAAIQYLRSAKTTPRLGGQLIDAVITDLRISPVFKDRIVLAMTLTVPYALNNLELHLLV
jgi:hypothetical protein